MGSQRLRDDSMRPTEPPWSDTIRERRVFLVIMGDRSLFDLLSGPRSRE